MFKDVFGGIAVGGAAVACLTYINNKKTQKNINKLKDENQSLKTSVTKAESCLEESIEELKYTKESNDEIRKTFRALRTAYENLCKFHNQTSICFSQLIDPNMLADICDLTCTSDRDACLKRVEDVVTTINRLAITHKDEMLTEDQVDTKIDKLHTIIGEMSDELRDIIRNSEDDDDEDDDEIEATTVSPKRILFTDISGRLKSFEADPDVGFEVLDGSDPENNDYCIIAQNIPPLYNLLFDSIKDQLKNHHTATIDADAFDNLLDDMLITVSFSFVNDDEAVITAVNAVVPFEIFTEDISDDKFVVYTIKEGELKTDNVMRYFRNSSRGNTVSSRKENSAEGGVETEISETSEEEIDVSMSADNIQFVVETIGFNRDALQSFAGKLNILQKVNPDVAKNIMAGWGVILREIHTLKASNKLTDEAIQQEINAINALYTQLKKHRSQTKPYFNGSSMK